MKRDKILNKTELILSENYTNDSVVSYMYSIKKFLDEYPAPLKLRLSDIENYFLKLKNQVSTKSNVKLSLGYRRTMLAGVKALFDCLLELNLIKEHPCKSYFLEKEGNKDKDFTSFLSLEEMELLLTLKEESYAHLGSRDKSMISILIYQGVTSKELIELTVNSIDFDNGVLKIKGAGKNKGRNLKLTQFQKHILNEYLEKDRGCLLSTKTNRLFISLRGATVTVDALNRMIKRLSGFTHKEISPKNIRSSVISYWINERKFSLEHVQIMAGHRYPSSTEKYIRKSSQENREVVSKLHESIFD